MTVIFGGLARWLTRSLGLASLGLASLLCASAALAQDYPTRPITLLVPQAPGASSDLLARTLGERFRRRGASRS